jgi:hypothetical protein
MLCALVEQMYISASLEAKIEESEGEEEMCKMYR